MININFERYSIERFTMASVDDLIQNFSEQIDLNSDTSNAWLSYVLNRKFIPLSELEKRISIFNGSNIDPSKFIDQCEAVHRVTHPLHLIELGYIIYSKLYGEARELMNGIIIHYDNIILELKRRYIDPRLLDWMYKFVVIKQEIYENPMQFGRKLQKMVTYAKETYQKTLPRTIANNQLVTVKNTALRTFKTKLADQTLMETLKQVKLSDLEEAINWAENIYTSINRLYLDNPTTMWRNENGYCMHCENSEFHYYNCLIHKNSPLYKYCGFTDNNP